jgi:hypothetical protein
MGPICWASRNEFVTRRVGEEISVYGGQTIIQTKKRLGYKYRNALTDGSRADFYELGTNEEQPQMLRCAQHGP